MTEYDPNLPQEFAHMPKRRGLGAVTLAMALVGLFLLCAVFLFGLFALSRVPAPTNGGPASPQVQSTQGRNLAP